MLVFIKNEPRAYAWGSTNALPNILRQKPTGEPQAELWLGDHAGDPAEVSRVHGERLTLIDLIKSAPEIYGVNGGSLPFLLKILGIGAPLSLQVHPTVAQARAGFALEEAAGLPLDAPDRSYKDQNHKPELLVALTRVRALVGFRDLNAVIADLEMLAAAAGTCGAVGAQPLLALAAKLRAELQAELQLAGAGDAAGADSDPSADADATSDADTNSVAAAASGADTNSVAAAQTRAINAAQTRAINAALDWIFSGSQSVIDAVTAIGRVLERNTNLAFVGAGVGLNAVAGAELDAEVRAETLREIVSHYPQDPGVLVSLFAGIQTLAPGEALYVEAGMLHAYLSGVAVEVMASSDNVLRAGLTPKHIDVAELRSILDVRVINPAAFAGVTTVPGLVSWLPEIPDFALHRATLAPESAPFEDERQGSAETVRFEPKAPTVLLVTDGQVRVERLNQQAAEVANVMQGQSVYVSAGDAIELSGRGEAFLATVGVEWA